MFLLAPGAAKMLSSFIWLPLTGTLILMWATEPVLTECNAEELDVPHNAHVLHVSTGEYAILECDLGYQFPGFSDGVLWCDSQANKWIGQQGICSPVKPSCDPNPCLNNGRCFNSEDPYGWGFYCFCSRSAGGRLCQIANPCQTKKCPAGTVRCIRSYTNDKARYCYNEDWVDLD